MRIVKCDEAGLEAAAEVLNAGGVAVIPTDTVYGLAAHPKFPEAVERLYSIKGRMAGKPIAMLAADAGCLVPGAGRLVPGAGRLVPGAGRLVPGAECLVPGAECLVPGAGRLVPGAGRLVPGAEKEDAPSTKHQAPSTPHQALSTKHKALLSHWPGGLTIVFGGEGYRVPDHDWTRRLLAKCGGLLRVTSANMSGRRAATDAEAALADVGLSADLVADDGVSRGGVASTVVKIEDDGSVTVLREGPVKI